MELREIIQKLAQSDWAIRIESDEHGIDYLLTGPAHTVTSDQVRRLIDEGWLHGFANGGGYRLSDEGRKAYLRSTDELGDGVLCPPTVKSTQENES